MNHSIYAATVSSIQIKIYRELGKLKPVAGFAIISSFLVSHYLLTLGEVILIHTVLDLFLSLIGVGNLHISPSQWLSNMHVQLSAPSLGPLHKVKQGEPSTS